MSATPPIFDGHNDLLLKLYMQKGGPAAEPFVDGTDGHLDLKRCREGGFAGGFFAIYVPSKSETDMDEKFRQMTRTEYDLGLPALMPWADAAPVALTQAALLIRLERLGALKICRTAAEITATMEAGTIAAILHMEGAEAIDEDFRTLDVLHAAGLRSLGPVWSRPTIFGHGVPFRFPSTGDTGPGLTDLGKELVRRCDALGIMIDLSHLNEAGFWDVAKISDKPLVATHSNAHAVCPHARNLTDRQLDAIAESDGMVGVNFALSFLREDGRMIDAGLDVVLKHFDYLIGKLGEDRVGFGSDFDGAKIPSGIGTASGLTAMRAAMRAHGFGDALMEKLCNGNWLRLIAKTIG